MLPLPMQFSLFDMNFNTWQCCWLYPGSPCRLQNKYFTFRMMIIHHRSPNGHPARQSTWYQHTAGLFFLGDSHCVGSNVAYDLIPESYLGCLGLVECPDPWPLQPAPPRPSRQAHLLPRSLPVCRPAILQARNLLIDVIYLHLMSGVLVLNQDPTDSKASPHVRRLGVEPRSYRQRRLSGTVTSSLFIEYHRYEPAYFFLLWLRISYSWCLHLLNLACSLSRNFIG